MKYDIPTMTAEAVSLLKSLISIPSISREETQAADFLQNYIEAEGMQTGRKGNNVWCLSPMFDLKKPTILLNSHIDTVKPVNGWRKDPFTPREENGKLYGLGSNDAGASVVSLLQVFLQLCRTSQNYNLIYLASCEEEVSGKEGIESVLPGLPPVSFAIVGEPTEMQPAIAEKGLMVLDVTATGKAGHAARDEGDNAIYKVLNDIAWFRDYRFEKESPLLGPVKMSVTVINAGTQHNVVPTESGEDGTHTFRFPDFVRSGIDVLCIGKDRSGTLFTFTYSRRVYYAERDRRGYRDLFRFVRRTKALVRLYHSSSRKSAICRCLTPSILSCHRSSILTTYLG